MNADQQSRIPDPSAMPGSGVDLARLREHVSELLDQAVTGGSLVSVPSQRSETVEADGVSATDHVDRAEQEPEAQLVEVTGEQLDALNEAHDALAEALSSLDSGRK